MRAPGSQNAFHLAATLRWHPLDVDVDAIVNDLPRGTTLDLGSGVQFGPRCRPNSDSQFWIIADPLRFTKLAEPARRSSDAFLGFFFHVKMIPREATLLLEETLVVSSRRKYIRDMKAIGYVRVSTEKQADFGVSLEAQAEKVRAMAVVQGAELVEIIVDAGESAKSLNRPGMARLMSLVDAGAVNAVIIAKLDRLTRSVKDLAELLERFTRRGGPW